MYFQKSGYDRQTTCLCASVCVSVSMCARKCHWPCLGRPVKRAVSRVSCESNQAFCLRFAGFITAPNLWPDKSSYFILHTFTSALLLSSFSPRTPVLSPSTRSFFFSFLICLPCFPSLFCMLLKPLHPSFLLSYTPLPALHPPPPSLLLYSMMNLWTGANNCTSAQVLIFLCVWKLWQAGALFPSTTPASLFSPPPFSLFFLSLHNGWVK